MDSSSSWISNAIAFAAALGTAVTAVATYFLWRVTKVLAHETTRMAEASSQPHIVATLKPNQWTMRHFDLHIDNTGNGTAYDVSVEFDPPLLSGGARHVESGVPFRRVSVLTPGQRLSSYLCDFATVKGTTYKVKISWRRNASSSTEEHNEYTLSMADYEKISQLGSDPLIAVAEHLKKIEEGWSPVANGARRTKLDIYTSSDRLHERREMSRERRRLRHEAAQNSAEQCSEPTYSSEA
jgi:hypothetical protein